MMRMEMMGDAALLARLRALPEAVRRELRTSMGALLLRLQRTVVQNKLSGQVLKVRTGTLRRSIHQRLTETPRAVEGAVGTNLSYGIAHERGYQGPQSVKAHMRHIKQAWGRSLKNPRAVAVRAHTRNVNLPPRSFLRTALQEMRTDIQTEISTAVAKGLHA